MAHSESPRTEVFLVLSKRFACCKIDYVPVVSAAGENTAVCRSVTPVNFYKLLGGKWVHSQVCTAAIAQIKINDKEQYHEH